MTQAQLTRAAVSTIKKDNGLMQIFHENGNTDDIINMILYADRWNGDTKSFSKYFNKYNLKALWLFVRKNIRYKVDPAHIEKVKTPAATWKSKVADCKSMSIFIASILKNLGIPYKYRFVAWVPGNVTHVYPVAIVDGKDIVLDAVHTQFNEELPYHHAYDYTPKGEAFGRSKVSGMMDMYSIAVLGILGIILIKSFK